MKFWAHRLRPPPLEPTRCGARPFGPPPFGPQPLGAPLCSPDPSGSTLPLPSSGGPPGLHFFWVWAPTFLIFIMLLIVFCVHLIVSISFKIFSSWGGGVEVSKPKTQTSFQFGEGGGYYPSSSPTSPKKILVWGESNPHPPPPPLTPNEFEVWGERRGGTTPPNPTLPSLEPVSAAPCQAGDHEKRNLAKQPVLSSSIVQLAPLLACPPRLGDETAHARQEVAYFRSSGSCARLVSFATIR